MRSIHTWLVTCDTCGFKLAYSKEKKVTDLEEAVFYSQGEPDDQEHDYCRLHIPKKQYSYGYYWRPTS